uniref:Uncharacterized protein n=1 Tax=Candidatus Kentrum sp. TC TaxID=2126339 RepID=A0A451A5P2_9GAMM|nr:MAG: hypothetical protein BECKTC1821E_GA0114239_105919 [Candidatus Kentron sp. TC]VFK48085.1 MAG: hypothetical protein BECKTC1821D_GA0114238_105719 [Candidatus Kentron sp. TC]VFK61348.1 MAG: hypothetical protein BECKTC1821F_GA0114240_105719 [Candidatus Kentron sp. TC]
MSRGSSNDHGGFATPEDEEALLIYNKEINVFTFWRVIHRLNELKI